MGRLNLTPLCNLGYYVLFEGPIKLNQVKYNSLKKIGWQVVVISNTIYCAARYGISIDLAKKEWYVNCLTEDIIPTRDDGKLFVYMKLGH